METKTINIQRTFNLPVRTVWKAWTEPELFKKWWGPKNYTCPHCFIDFKVGGKYLTAMQDEKGHTTWSTGVYEEIIPDTRIVLTDSFSYSDGTIISGNVAGLPGKWPEVLVITIEFQEHEGKTLFLLKHEGIPAEMYEDCIQSWLESFDKLENSFIPVA
jgi:uncharacterized protein YndB with AHSA1/START domain